MNALAFTRRQALTAALAAAALPTRLRAEDRPALLYPDAPIRLAIEQTSLELAKGVTVPTTTYNGTVPGPLLTLSPTRRSVVHVTNNTSRPELVHWHGLHIPSPVDGAMEEGSPMIAPGQTGTYDFLPGPSGTRWYHTHAMAGRDLSAGGYSGQFGFIDVDDGRFPASYDREIFLAVHHWNGELCDMGAPVSDQMVCYRYATFNGRLFAAAEPLRVRAGERVRFRFVNASATQNTAIALPGHRFRIIALDGNPVPTQASVEVIRLGVAERVDAIVEMNNPGVWMLGATNDTERASGLALAVEYAGQSGPPRWLPSPPNDWDYSRFALPGPTTQPEVDGIIPMVISKRFLKKEGMDEWRINSEVFEDAPVMRLVKGRRYRFRFFNASREDHPVHLHRHSFEITAIAGRPVAGVVKDTVVLPLYGSLDVDLRAENPGLSLFHCHQQIHMDYGFMRLISY
ncbi:multicopper oxidase domain-containing protein [Gluconacetobacter sp. 1c LMG 22058]|uniref:Multicopper oxidase domain-containing protein n=1 Tax=Gluconacetobacter dulcium TaxID=2729096 RepID=A0A7W4PK07_9PROT|nr:multicopper oxidase domain-containing protein [Gluconacetobacter dulcium]MBB2199134.1 multicopper oxidase domain-containing protein [Gluconacetobacter dulcium]